MPEPPRNVPMLRPRLLHGGDYNPDQWRHAPEVWNEDMRLMERDLIHAETAEVLATYGGEFYRGQPAATVRPHGQGQAYYLASRNDTRFHDDFYRRLMDRLALPRSIVAELPQGVTAPMRHDDERAYVFLTNFTGQEQTLTLDDATYRDRLAGEPVAASLTLPPYGVRVLERPRLVTTTRSPAEARNS